MSNNGPRWMRDYRGNLVAVPAEQFLLEGRDPGFGTRKPNLQMREMYERLPDADIHGAPGLGNTHGGEMDRIAQLNAHRQQLMPEPGKEYRPLTALADNNRGWGINIEIGGTNPQFGNRTEASQTVVHTGMKTGDDAESIIVTLGMIYPSKSDPGFQTTRANVVADIEWGVGGANFQAEIDWRLGAIFVVPASMVKVTARWERLFGVDLVRVQLLASLTYGTPSSGKTSSPARRTIIVGDFAPLQVSNKVEIPLWANNFTLTDITVGDPDFTIEVLDCDEVIAVFQKNDDTNCCNQNENTFPLPNASRFLRITNNLGTPVAGVRAIFNLAI